MVSKTQETRCQSVRQAWACSPCFVVLARRISCALTAPFSLNAAMANGNQFSDEIVSQRL